MATEPKPCANGCGRTDIKNQKVHDRFCPKIQSSSVYNPFHPPSARILKEEKIDKSTISTHDTSDKGSTWWQRNISQREKYKSKHEIKDVCNPEDLINGLKPYQILDSNPKTGIGKFTNRNKDFIQVVLVSELIEPKTFWAEKTGMNRIQYKDRMYKLPRDIRGNIFFWHVDKKQPLIDTAEASQGDAESSFHELQLFNMAYSVGRAAGANDLLNNLKLILIITGFMCFLVIITLIYLSRIDKAMAADDAAIINILNNINQTVSVTH